MYHFSLLLKHLAALPCETKVQNVAIALPVLADKAVNSTKLKKFFQHLKKHLFSLLIYCLVEQHMYQSRVHDIEELKQHLLDIWHGLDRMLIE